MKTIKTKQELELDFDDFADLVSEKPKIVKKTKKIIVPKAPMTMQEIQEQVDRNQLDRYQQLTEAQKSWGEIDWMEFISKNTMLVTDEISPAVVTQLNYGRVYLRELREKRAEEAREARKPGNEIAAIVSDEEPKPFVVDEHKNVLGVVDVVTEAKASEAKALENHSREAVKRDKQVDVIVEHSIKHGSNSLRDALAQSKQILAKSREAKVEMDAVEVPGSSPVEFVDESVMPQADEFEMVFDEEIAKPEPVEHPSRKSIETAQMMEANPKSVMWEAALKIASTTPASEWKTLGFAMRSLVEHAAFQMKDGGEIIEPFELSDIFIPRPRFFPEMQTNDAETSSAFQTRREMIHTRIFAYWRKTVALDSDSPTPQMNLKSDSYRTILKAIKLGKCIDDYVYNFLKAGKPEHEPDEVLEKRVGTALAEYAQAHFPIPKDKIKPGPITDFDPDYIKYRELCTIYKINPGQLLHEVEL